MRWKNTAPLATLTLFTLCSAACVQTSRVADDLSTAKLAETKKAVAVMRIGSASPVCEHAAVLLGQREHDYFKPRQPIVIVANIRSATEPAVAEVELDPGEYHIVAYSCRDSKGPKVVADKGSGSQFYRTSYASFTLSPGEIVNVGYLHLEASRVGRNAFGREIRTKIAITDWPLAELDRFKAKRPTIFVQMTTRLMIATDRGPTTPNDNDCARLAALQREGKVQTLPASCAPQPKPSATSKQAPAG